MRVMAIYDKDGNVYKLKGAVKKPINNTQWDKVVFHNFEWDTITVPNDMPDVTKFKTDIEKVVETPVIPEIRESKTVEKPVPVAEVAVVEEEAEPVVEYTSPETNKFFKENKVLMWCLPMKRVERVDAVYGETYYNYEAGVKFRLEGIVISQEDLIMHFWTRNVTIEKDSIITIVGNKSVRENRWWKVYKTEEKSGGTLIEAIPSDYSPDFS